MGLAQRRHARYLSKLRPANGKGKEVARKKIAAKRDCRATTQNREDQAKGPVRGMSATRGEVSRVEHARVRRSVAVVSGRKSLVGVFRTEQDARCIGCAGTSVRQKNTPRRSMIQIKMSGNDLKRIILFCTFWEEELIALVVPAAVDQATTLVSTSVDGYRWMLASALSYRR
jgi:hypothetical protein